MKEVAKLMDYRSDVRVIDATLRDGGLVNDFYFIFRTFHRKFRHYRFTFDWIILISTALFYLN